MSSPAATPPHVHKDVHKDYEGAKLGMWLFLFTEILLFGGLFHTLFGLPCALSDWSFMMQASISTS